MLIRRRHNGDSGHQRTPDQVCVSVGGSSAMSAINAS
jgi:hypothetical protein